MGTVAALSTEINANIPTLKYLDHSSGTSATLWDLDARSLLSRIKYLIALKRCRMGTRARCCDAVRPVTMSIRRLSIPPMIDLASLGAECLISSGVC